MDRILLPWQQSQFHWAGCWVFFQAVTRISLQSSRYTRELSIYRFQVQNCDIWENMTRISLSSFTTVHSSNAAQTFSKDTEEYNETTAHFLHLHSSSSAPKKLNTREIISVQHWKNHKPLFRGKDSEAMVNGCSQNRHDLCRTRVSFTEVSVFWAQ